ncbi:hypothetical protein D910_06569 [Dendroctonus ponderosae]|uniref:Uncharacterized protein n=2 Tax=Dendroctonus ponderosae TaxID=77166 RepID=U4UH21_DENPD|nr:hypothetical protein D910_06569 [Dendroctonus ponderosae]
MKGLSLLNTRASPLYRADSSANRAIEFQLLARICPSQTGYKANNRVPRSRSNLELSDDWRSIAIFRALLLQDRTEHASCLKRCTMSYPFHHHHHGPGSNSLVKEIIHEMIRPHHGPPPPPPPYHHYGPPPPPPHHHYGPPPPPPPHHHYGPPPHHFHGPPPPPPHHHHGPPHHFHGPPPPCGHHSQFYGCSHCDGWRWFRLNATSIHGKNHSRWCKLGVGRVDNHVEAMEDTNS